MSKIKTLLSSTSVVVLIVSIPAMATDFTIPENNTEISTQALSGTSGSNTGYVLGDLTTSNNTAVITSNTGNIVAIYPSGSIETTGASANGIFHSSDINISDIAGSLSTNGADAHGVYNSSSRSITDVSGKISTKGADAHGVLNIGNANITSVSSSVFTEGDGSNAILNKGNQNISSITGIVSSSGENSNSIENVGSNNEVIVFGSVLATGKDSSAISNSGGSGNTISLQDGSIIKGAITAEKTSSNNALNFNIDRSYAYFVGHGDGAGEWVFTDVNNKELFVTKVSLDNCTSALDTDGSPVVSKCVLVRNTALTTNFEFQDKILYSLNSSLINSLELNKDSSGRSPKRTAKKTGGVFVFPEPVETSKGWMRFYGSDLKRPQGESLSEISTSIAGVSIGIPVEVMQHDVEFVFNYANSITSLYEIYEEDVDSTSINIGIVLPGLYEVEKTALSVFGFLGHNSYDRETTILVDNSLSSNFESMSKYSSLVAIAGLKAKHSNPISNKISIISDISASIANENLDDYSDEYFTWSDQNIVQATVGIGAGIEYKISRDITTYAGASVDRAMLLSDKSNSQNYGSLEVGFVLDNTSDLSLSGSLKNTFSEEGLSGSNTNLSLKFVF